MLVLIVPVYHDAP